MSSFDGDDKSEIETVKALLEAEKQKNSELEEQCDLLAATNYDLREEVDKLKMKLRIYTALKDDENKGVQRDDDRLGDAASDSAKAKEEISKMKTELYSAYPVEGGVSNVSYANKVRLRISNPCGASNPLCVSFCYPTDLKVSCSADSGEFASVDDVVLCGGADKSITAYSLDGVKMKSWGMGAPVLSISTWSNFVACSTMDGSIAVVDLSKFQYGAYSGYEATTEECADSENDGFIRFNNHSKYVVKILFSDDGMYIASLSYDRTINLYEYSAEASNWVLKSTFDFDTTPEAMLFLPEKQEKQEKQENAANGDAPVSTTNWKLLIAGKFKMLFFYTVGILYNMQ